MEQKEQVLDFWTPERWKGYWDSGNPYRQYKFERDRSLAMGLLMPEAQERVLEVGCGYGRISEALFFRAQGIFWIGVDRSLTMLQACREVLQGRTFLCHSDAQKLPFQDESFDAVLCNGVLMHCADEKEVLDELCRVLKRGGRLVVSGNNLFSPWAIPVALWGLVRSQVRQSFRAPWFYHRFLAKRGIRIHRAIGDTVLAVGAAFPGSRTPLLPRRLFPFIRTLDRWVDRFPLRYLAYEIWFLGVKG